LHRNENLGSKNNNSGGGDKEEGKWGGVEEEV
jgi:hypothetical protein